MQSPSGNDKKIQLGFEEQQSPYDSPSQNARVLTEGWMVKWIYCPACGNDEMRQFANNRPTADFDCPNCSEQFELKSKKGKFGNRVVDGAYKTMCERLTSDDNPNFAFMQYDAAARAVQNLFVVPKQFVVPRIIEERRPLAATARRAGWIGCNIQLDQVPSVGRIFIVQDGEALSKRAVLERWQSTLFLRQASLDARGWLMAVMTCCQAIGRQEFGIDDVYAFEGQLKLIYPGNKHIKEKIRQQLQVLRDHGFLEFMGRGRYRLN